MGLSASQSRLLSLTSRMSDLELQAQTISNAKIRLSQESSQASKNYSAALDKQTMKVYSGLQSDGTSSYIEATAANLTGYHVISSTDKQRFIKTSSGQLLVSEDVEKGYNMATAGSWCKDSLKTADEYRSMSKADLVANTSTNAALVEFLFDAKGRPNADGSATDDEKNRMNDFNTMLSGMSDSEFTYYKNLFAEALESGGCTSVGDDNMKDSQWLSEQIQAGNLYLYEYDEEGGANGTGDYVGVSWTSGDNSLQFQSDDTDTAKAEADYEATMADIETKDKQFDLELQNINTEHTAIQTEVDSVKKIINKNIDRSFKIFDA